MSAPAAELALLQSRIQSLERDLSMAQRRLEVKDEEIRQLKATQAKKDREASEREAVLEGRCHIAEQELAKQHTRSPTSGGGPPVVASMTPSMKESFRKLTTAQSQPATLSLGPSATHQPTHALAGSASSATAGDHTRAPSVASTLVSLPLRPLLPYTEDSPFYRKEQSAFAEKVNSLSTRLKKIVKLAKDFSQSTSKFAETASALSNELSTSWSEVEGGLDSILQAAILIHSQQLGVTPPGVTSPRPGGGNTKSPNGSSPLAPPADDFISLSSAFGKLGAMLSTVCDIGNNLAVSVDAFLVNALVDFRSKHIQEVLDKEIQLKRSQEEYENALVKRLGRKHEKSLFGTIGIITEKMKKKQQQEDEEIRVQILYCSNLRKSYELLRYDYVSLLNEVLLERRMELIEMVCASFLGFITFFKEGAFVADTIKLQVDQINRSINHKRPLYHASNDTIKEQRGYIEKALENSVSLGASNSSPPTSHALEKVLNWKVKDLFPSSQTASGLMSPEAQSQSELGLVLLPPTPMQTKHNRQQTNIKIPSPYAHALIRGKLVPVEKEGYLRKQSSSLKKDWKKRWFILQNGQLFYVRDDTDLNPVHVQAVLLCTVRHSQKSDLDLCFDLISPNKRVYTLQAETEDSMKSWMECFGNVSEALLNASGNTLTAQEQSMSQSELKEHTESKQHAVSELRKLNPLCVDCSAADPDWASINLGIMICIECSGIHRSLGVHISKVRSIVLDSWTTELLDLMKNIGNVKFNALYEGSLVDADAAMHATKPLPTSTREQKEEYIQLKYGRKAFLSKSVLSQASVDTRQHVEEFHAAAKKNDVRGLMNWLSLGVKIDEYVKTMMNGGGGSSNGQMEGANADASSQLRQDRTTSFASNSPSTSPRTRPTHSPSFSASSATSPLASPNPAAAAASSSSSSSSSSVDNTPGTRALHIAARYDHILSLEFLLQNNARETLLDENGQTALQVAQAAGSTKCANRLKGKK